MPLRSFRTLCFALLLTAMGTGTAYADLIIGRPAPDFTATDAAGKEVTLSEFKGKPVVLEWTNYDCPFVRKHYNSGNMQALQKEYTGRGVTWLSIISSAKGKQGYLEGKDAEDALKARGAAPTHLLLDASGAVGRLYSAKTTPHMFVIDAKGNLAYMGAIDDKPNTNPDDAKKARNFVRLALDNLLAGKRVETVVGAVYGCSIKY